jgi:hypothetical protein
MSAVLFTIENNTHLAINQIILEGKISSITRVKGGEADGR